MSLYYVKRLSKSNGTEYGLLRALRTNVEAYAIVIGLVTTAVIFTAATLVLSILEEKKDV